MLRWTNAHILLNILTATAKPQEEIDNKPTVNSVNTVSVAFQSYMCMYFANRV